MERRLNLKTSLDAHFTPSSIAQRMVSASSLISVSSIADFAVGDGALLRAAAVRWPQATVIGTDIEHSFVRQTRRRHPDWRTGRCDFLRARSRQACRALQGVSNKTDLVLLNPPFSCRGAHRISVTVQGPEGQANDISCSVALGFTLTALAYLAPGGEMIALVPSSCLTSEKDRTARLVLEKAFLVETVECLELGAFPKCAARTVILRIRHKNLAATVHSAVVRQAARHAKKKSGDKSIAFELDRGNQQMHRSSRGLRSSVPLVHTTELRNGNIEATRVRASPSARTLCGPAVLLPRVGQPSASKVVLYVSPNRIALSDCVIAIKCFSTDGARCIWQTIQDNWNIIAQSYQGTCARYLTLRRLSTVLHQLLARNTVTPVDNR